MADSAMAARSPLAGRSDAAQAAGDPGVVVTERPAGRVFIVLARAGGANELVQRCQAFGVALPTGPRRIAGRGFGIVWTGPGQWLVQADEREADRLLRLFSSFDTLCSTVIADDTRVFLTIGGPRARDALAKMLTIDLHPRAFRPGHAAVTVAGSMSVILWQGADESAFECAVPRSYAQSFWDWLLGSAAEYGCAVEVAGGSTER